MTFTKRLILAAGVAPASAWAGSPVVITWGPPSAANVPVMGEMLLLALAGLMVIVVWRLKHLLPSVTSTIILSAATGIALIAGVGVADKAGALSRENKPVRVESSSGSVGLSYGTTCVDNVSGSPVQIKTIEAGDPDIVIEAPEGVVCSFEDANGGVKLMANGGYGSAAPGCVAQSTILADGDSCAISVIDPEVD